MFSWKTVASILSICLGTALLGGLWMGIEAAIVSLYAHSVLLFWFIHIRKQIQK